MYLYIIMVVFSIVNSFPFSFLLTVFILLLNRMADFDVVVVACEFVGLLLLVVVE